MEGWKSEVLSDVIDLVSGGTPSTTNEDFWNGEIPWLSVDDFNTSKRFVFDATKKISELGLKNSATKLLDVGDVIISARGTVGVIAQLGSAMAFNQSCYGIKQKVSDLSIDFIYYYLLYYFKSIGVVKSGSTFDTITKKTFDEILISFPTSSSEQYKISTILSTIDRSIDQTDQLIAKYKNIKQGLMHDLLTFGIDEKGTIRNPHTHTFMEKNGMVVPKEWEVKRIDEISEVNPNKEKEIPSIVSFIAMGDVSENAKLISPKLIAFRTVKNGFTPFKRGDILVAKITPCFENGKGAFLNELYSEYGFGSTEFHVLRSKINAYFLYIHTTSIPFRNKLSAQMTGSAGQRRVSTDAIRNYKIGIPSIFEQQKIVSILEQQGKLIESEQANLAKLQMLKQGLMQDLLTGKVRVEVNA